MINSYPQWCIIKALSSAAAWNNKNVSELVVYDYTLFYLHYILFRLGKDIGRAQAIVTISNIITQISIY